jgi:hypothetical protein
VVGVCCCQGLLLTAVPLRPASGVALRDAEALSPGLTVDSLVPQADVSPLLACAVPPAGLAVAAALVWPVVLALVVWEVARARSGVQGLVALVEPTRPSPEESLAASVGLASHLVALPPLAPALLKTHQAV